MNLREIFIHRMRDFDAPLRSNKKARLLLYSIMRQFSKILKYDESNFKNLIVESKSNLKNFKIINREKSLDFLFSSRFYEPETTKFIIGKKGSIFLDMGAHIERMSVLASNNFGKVYSFEPQKSTFKVLEKNIKINNLENVNAFNFPLSDKVQTLYLSSLKMNTGAAKISSSGESKTKATTLDKFTRGQKMDVKKVSLIKIDVEGHELKVLKGAKNLLEKGNPVLIIESFELDKVEAFLSKYGYKKSKVLDFYNHVFKKIKP